LEQKYDRQADRMSHYEITEKEDLRRLITKQFYGKWFVPPKDWEKTLHQGYLDNVACLIKPSDPKIDI
jgi:hypothetical protein